MTHDEQKEEIASGIHPISETADQMQDISVLMTHYQQEYTRPSSTSSPCLRSSSRVAVSDHMISRTGDNHTQRKNKHIRYKNRKVMVMFLRRRRKTKRCQLSQMLICNTLSSNISFYGKQTSIKSRIHSDLPARNIVSNVRL